MRDSLVETLIGALVILAAMVFAWFALARGSDAPVSKDAREFGARFSSVSGVERGADVRVSGVKVGVVRGISLDSETNEARMVLSVDSALSVFDDAVARIQSDGLLGGAYVSLDPGYDAFELGPVVDCGAGESLFDGSGCNMINQTQGSVDLLTLFASFAGGQGGDSGNSASSDDGFEDYPE
ncbi:MAG: MlaD family protein [Hyphomonadaceae bacterium]|nr:MlaD family protein [Hyphomonadaceae bacterium]